MSFLGLNAPKFVYRRGESGRTFTADAGTDQITPNTIPTNFKNGDIVFLSTTDTLPAPLTINTIYYIVETSGNTHNLAETKGGSAINITDTGTGTHTMSREYTVLLDYAFNYNNNVVSDSGEQKSDLDARRMFNHKGQNLDFGVDINIFKYTNPESKYREIHAFLRRSVSLYLHKDGNYMKDINGNEVLFTLTDLLLFYLDSDREKDVVRLMFKSEFPVDFAGAGLSTISYQASELYLEG